LASNESSDFVSAFARLSDRVSSLAAVPLAAALLASTPLAASSKFENATESPARSRAITVREGSTRRSAINKSGSLGVMDIQL
jgi:hypothetical protein